MSEWQVAKEVFLSIIKWFLLFVFANNLIWGFIFWRSIESTSIIGDTIQDGLNNKQEVSYGK